MFAFIIQTEEVVTSVNPYIHIFNMSLFFFMFLLPQCQEKRINELTHEVWWTPLKMFNKKKTKNQRTWTIFFFSFFSSFLIFHLHVIPLNAHLWWKSASYIVIVTISILLSAFFQKLKTISHLAHTHSNNISYAMWNKEKPHSKNHSWMGFQNKIMSIGRAKWSNNWTEKKLNRNEFEIAKATKRSKWNLFFIFFVQKRNFTIASRKS